MVIISQFGQRYYQINSALRIAHYVAQGLLFFANERAFYFIFYAFSTIEKQSKIIFNSIRFQYRSENAPKVASNR
uniref:Uncharacterized protein n=1 Tax=Ascaris lumbricoides TaxID=6252 RepID=A0A0M3I298_ASCLU